MPNVIAYLSIAVWPLVILFLFKKYGVERGILAAIFISYMFLPASFEINFPGIPAFNKGTTTVFTIVTALFIMRRSFGFDALRPIDKFIFFCFCLSPFLTAITNTERYMHIAGVSLYDGLSQAVMNLLIIFPFILGAKYFRNSASQILLLKSFVIFALFYSLLILYEIRMSPQLHTMLYGYFPHSFAQQYRAGGFRAVVFLGHGLLVALFVAIAFVCSVGLMKSKIRILGFGIQNWAVVVFLFIVLVLSKSYAALVFAVFAFFALKIFSDKKIHMVAILFTFVYLSYPFMSANNIFPHDALVSIAESVDASRAQSLGFRFYHESQLLQHANDKPVFGWGSWGRNRIYDPETFEDLSVTDGRWAIILGTRGWFGFITEFYFIMMAIILSAKASVKLSANSNYKNNYEKTLLALHALIVSLILMDQLPNSSLNYFYWFIIGALHGRVSDIIFVNRSKV